jgi:hypothetical protein
VAQLHDRYMMMMMVMMMNTKLTIITGTSHEHQYTLLTISCSFLLTIKKTFQKILEEIKTHISYSKNVFQKCIPKIYSKNVFQNPAVCEVMLATSVKLGRPQITI